jgi:fructose-1,6-bisphosphatase/inositol monophosphatase family enzyme
MLKKEIKTKFPDVKQFLMEENFKMKNFKKIEFDKPLAIIDPIDGTENYLANNNIFGSVFSIVNIKKNINSLYIPNEKILINDKNVYQISTKPKKHNKIILASTKCIKVFNKVNPNIRVFGSASYMFYLFISGKCNEYIYCRGAKIWDCYTGLSLCNKLNCKIKLKNNNIKDWLKKPTFLTNFHIKWQ